GPRSRKAASRRKLPDFSGSSWALCRSKTYVPGSSPSTALTTRYGCVSTGASDGIGAVAASSMRSRSCRAIGSWVNSRLEPRRRITFSMLSPLASPGGSTVGEREGEDEGEGEGEG